MPTSIFNPTATGDDGFIGSDLASGAWPPTSPYGFQSNPTLAGQEFGFLVRKYRPSWGELAIGMLRFDTSALPDDATVTSAFIRVWVTGKGSSGTRNACWSYWDEADWPPDAADVSTSSTPLADAATTPLTSFVDETSLDITLSNLSNITLNGYTAFRVEIDGGDPGATDYRFHLAEYGHTTKPIPALHVTYTTPNQDVNVTGLGTAAAFGSVGVTPGGVLVPISGLGSAAAFGSVGASSGGILVDVAGLGSAASFGSVAPLAGNRDVAVAGLGSAAAFGSVDTDAMAYANVPGLTSAAQFGSVSPTVGGVNVPVSGLESAAQFGSVSTTGGAAPTDLNPAARGYYF